MEGGKMQFCLATAPVASNFKIMDERFRDLLARYVRGQCTAEEQQRIHRWYEQIADTELKLDETEKRLMRGRMLAKIRQALPSEDRTAGKHRHIGSHMLMKIAASLLLTAAVGLWLVSGEHFFDMVRRSENAQISGEVIIENETADTRTYPLPDGSTVRLEPSGRIWFSRKFSTGDREVYLAGKAFFDIVKEPARPFVVYSGTIATRVLGTSFFVDATADARKVEVKVITGKVSVFEIAPSGSADKANVSTSTAGNGVVLSPNQKVEYFIDGGHWVTGLVEDPAPVKAIGKETLSFVFSNTLVKDVLADVNERYGIEVVTENEKILGCTFTGDLSQMSLYDMLDVISNSIGATYEVKGTRILMTGKGCNS